MMTEEEQLKALLRKHYSAPAAAIDPDALLRSKKEALIEIYKQNKKYTWLAAAAIALLFAVKKSGISVSIAHCYIAIVAVPAFIVTGAAVGSVYTYTAHKSRIAAPAAAVPAPQTMHAEPAESAPASYAVTIQPFRHDELSAAKAEKIETALMTALNREKGNGYISRSGTASQGKVIAGSVLSAGEGLTVSIRLIDGNANVLLFEQKTLKNEAELIEFTESAAKKILSL